MRPNINKVRADFLVKGHLAGCLLVIRAGVFFSLRYLGIYRVSDESISAVIDKQDIIQKEQESICCLF